MNEKELLEIEIDYTTDIRHIKLVAEVRRLKENEEKYIGQLTWIKDNFTAELKINEKYVIESINQVTGSKKGKHVVDRMKGNLVKGENELIRLREESQLYKELYTKVNTQNMVYKVALEKHISILRSVLQVIKNQIDYDEGIALGGVIVQLEKALWSDTNES